MYDKILNFYGFKKIPFSKNIAKHQIFISSQIKEAQARLDFCLKNEDIALILGNVGSGKTTALRYFSSHIDSNVYKLVYFAVDKIKLHQILQSILRGIYILTNKTNGFETPWSVKFIFTRIVSITRCCKGSA